MSVVNTSTLPYNTSDQQDPNMAQFVHYIHVIGIPMIVITGVIGNTVSFLVFSRSSLRFKSSSVYLAFMNIADTGMLLSLVPVWLAWLHIDVYFYQGCCQLFIYFPYVFSFLSVWVVVSFTIERYVVVFYPLLRNSICTVKKAMVSMVGLTSLAFILYCYVLWTTESRERNGLVVCTGKLEYKVLLDVLSGVDTVITLLVPSVALVFLNASIAWKLFWHNRTNCEDLGTPLKDRRRRRRRQRGSTSSSSSEANATPSTSIVNNSLKQHQAKNSSLAKTAVLNRSTENKPPSPSRAPKKCTKLQSSRKNSQLKTTRSLLVVSCVFLLLNLPSHAFRVTMFVLQLLQIQPGLSRPTLDIIQEIFHLFHYINFATNFFLYVGSSTCFRDALRTLWAQGLKRTLCLRARPRTTQQHGVPPHQTTAPVSCCVAARNSVCRRLRSIRVLG